MVQELTKETDALTTEAKEKKNRIDLLVKSNALGTKSHEKRREVQNEDRNIDGQHKRPKQMYTWIFFIIIGNLIQGQ